MKISGLGNIFREVAERALAFGMRVLAVRRQQIIPNGLDIQLVDLPTLLTESDFISINAALNEETHHMIGERELEMMKESAILINTARGAIIDEDALHRTLLDNRIAGAGIDVFSEEKTVNLI